MAHALKAAGLLTVAFCISMIVVLVFEGIKFLLGWPVAVLVAFLVAAGLAWSLARLAE